MPPSPPKIPVFPPDARAFSRGRIILMIAALAFPPMLNAARCDCSSDGWISDCTATLKPDGDGVLVTSSSTQCSRVDWHLGQSPQVSVFWGGREWEPLQGQSRANVFSIESCRVCRDGKAGDPASRTPRQVIDASSSQPDRGSGDCNDFLKKMQDIGLNTTIENAERQMQRISSLCGSDINACMQKIQRCSL